MEFVNARKVVSATLVFALALGALAMAMPSARAVAMEAAYVYGDLPEARLYGTAAQVDGSLYVFGGFVSDIYGVVEDALDTVLIFDIGSGETTLGASMPTGMALSSCAVGQDGLVYVFGGYNSSIYGYNPSVQVYDPERDSWSSGTDSPIPLGGGQAVCGSDGRFYLFGAGVWYQLNSTLIYDPSADEWTYGADQPGQYAMRGVAVLDETSIMVCGGYDYLMSTATDVAHVYDIEADSWTPVSSMPVASNMGGAAVSGNGLVYFLGGVSGSWTDDGTVYDTIQVYDPALDSWGVSSAVLPGGRSSFAIASDGYGHVFVAGGYDGGVTVSTVILMISLDVEMDGISIISPSDGAVVSGDVAVTVQWTNPWMWLNTVVFYVDGDVVDTQVSNWPNLEWTFTWYTSGLEDGSSHELMVQAFFSDGTMKDDSVTVTYSEYSLEERIDMLEAQLAALQDSVDTQTMDLAAMNETIGALQAELDALSSDLADVDAASAERIAALEDQLAALDSLLGEMQDALDDSQSSVDELQDSVDGVQTSVDKKADGMLMYVVILLLVVVIVLMVVMMMGRKSAPPPPPSA